MKRVIEVEEGFQQLALTVEGMCDIQFHIDKHRSAILYLTYSGMEAEITQTIVCEANASLSILVKNETSDLIIHDCTQVNQDAQLQIGYLDLAAGKLQMDSNILLKAPGAYVKFMSAAIVSQTMQYHILCEHATPHTSAYMENYAVVKAHGNYAMEACGKIKKGAYGSATHQASRVLTLSQDQNSSVVPLLLIDENDVQASHATTLGQPDENQLYYLQTRGLNRQQALGLLTIGYMLPITELLQEKELQAALKDEIEMKVGLHA